MTSPRKRILAEGLLERLVAIQRAKEINEELWRWKRKHWRLDIAKKTEVGQTIAERVERFALSVKKKTRRSASPQQIREKIARELENIRL